MLRTLFIADLHLCQEESAITVSFLRFLQCEAQTADALYILGDLFEFWIGDDDPNPHYQQIAMALRALPLPVYFIHGNRDFLLGSHYANTSGITLLPEEQVLNLYGHSVLIMHGDTLCTNDKRYQKFRHKIHQHWIQKLFLTFPLNLRQYIALLMRNGSKNTNSQKSATMMDVNKQTVNNIMQRYQVQWLIHGHTHQPAIHTMIVNDQPAKRLVLGSWHSTGSMIEVTPQSINLIYFPF